MGKMKELYIEMINAGLIEGTPDHAYDWGVIEINKIKNAKSIQTKEKKEDSK